MTHPDTATTQSAEAPGRLRAVSHRVRRHHEIVVGLVLGGLIFLGRFPPTFPFDNQSTYLLNGLAAAGFGNLAADWTATAQTPFVVFSAIIRGLAEIEFLSGIHVVEGVLVCIFAIACTLLASRCRVGEQAAVGAVSLFALLLLAVAMHSGFMVFMLRGMAGQYLLGMYLQPSEFGVLLLLSVALFVARKPLAPYVLAALAGVFHQSYLLVGAILVIGFASYQGIAERRFRTALAGSVVALTIVAPVVWYSYATFLSGTAGDGDAARRILAEFRFPNHALPFDWFDRVEALKIVVMALASALAWFVDRRLAHVMTLTAAFGLALSSAALLAGSNGLYLLFPWRVSVVLMPLATVVMVSQVVRLIVDTPIGRHLTGTRAAVVMLPIAIGVTVFAVSERQTAMRAEAEATQTAEGRIQDLSPDYRALARFAGENAFAGDVFLHNPSNFSSFRIRSGQRAYVDFKSHPYRSDQVLDWWDRHVWARRLFIGGWSCGPSLAKEFGDREITHIIVDKLRDVIDPDRLSDCLALGGVTPAVAFDNRTYRVIRLDWPRRRDK